MKTLYLIRHAKASWDHPEQPDIERTLTELGETDAHNIAQRLKKEGCKPDLIIASTAARALKTAEIFAEELGYPLDKITTDSHIYTGGVEEIVQLIKTFNSKTNTILLIGHNPTLTLLSHFLCEGLHMTITTCGVLGMGFEMKDWKEVVETEGQFLAYTHPHHDFPDAHVPDDV